jgi:siderophore synthetase component
MRHYGPMAQDFHAAFGRDAVGTSGNETTINSGDLAGITLIAVKELAAENAALKQQLASLAAKDLANAALKQRLAEQEAEDKEREARLARLEQLVLAAKGAPDRVSMK